MMISIAERTTTTIVISHWIDGKEVPSTSGRTAPVFDPALGIATKEVALADDKEIDAAVASAKAASPAWRDLSLAKRQGHRITAHSCDTGHTKRTGRDQ